MLWVLDGLSPFCVCLPGLLSQSTTDRAAEGHKQQKFIISQFQRWEVWDQHVGRAGSVWGPEEESVPGFSPWFIVHCLPSILTQFSLWRPYLQIKSQSKVLGVGTPVYPFSVETLPPSLEYESLNSSLRIIISKPVRALLLAPGSSFPPFPWHTG